MHLVTYLLAESRRCKRRTTTLLHAADTIAMQLPLTRLVIICAAVICLGAGGPSPWIGEVPADVAQIEPPVSAGKADEESKELAMDDSSESAGQYQPPAPILYAPGYVRLFNAQTRERYAFYFRDESGNYDIPVLNYFDWFLRCHKDRDQYIKYDWRVIEYLNLLSYYLGRPEILVTSGYRTPRHNAWLRSTGTRTAARSLHMRGQALDISVPGMRLDDVWRAAYYARQQLGFGGLGYYPYSNFIHIDSGPLRTW